jgi:class 3 adenylate cyclase
MPTQSSRVEPIRIAEPGTAIDGERKTVTALFADIKGSTALIEDLDPEEARALIDPALQLMIEAVRRYGGHIVQSTGDGIFALFGAPIAHEEHPQRAIHAALRMQAGMHAYAAKLRANGRAPIEIRVGINTGEVVVRTIRTNEQSVEYTPIGHTTNLASRLQTIALTGAVVISGGTERLVAGYFKLKPMGPVKIRGVSEPVERLRGDGAGAAAHAPPGVDDARALALYRARRGTRANQRCARNCERRARADDRGARRSGRRQVAAVLRIQGDCPRELSRARGVRRLARRECGLYPGDRIVE